MRSRFFILTCASIAALLGACQSTGEEEIGSIDLGEVGGDKADFGGILDFPLEVPRRSHIEFTFTARGPFEVRLEAPEGSDASDPHPENPAQLELRATIDGQVSSSEVSAAPVLTMPGDPAVERRVRMRVSNRASRVATTLLTIGPANVTPPPPEPGAPVLRVRFTQPVCAAIPDKNVPEGVRCRGTAEERDQSRALAGITTNLLQWIDETRAVKEAHPEREVKITMAYLTWSDGRINDALCRATAAGVKFDGVFDVQNSGTQPMAFMGNQACKPENIKLTFLAGRTDWPNWRLMHMKIFMFETADPSATDAMTRLVFGSANMSSAATSIHFENWVFSEVPSTSHFVEAHRCAVAALKDAAAVPYPGDAARFRSSYDACESRIAAPVDPRLRVFFAPDPQMRSLRAATQAIRNAQHSVSMAIEHFDDYELATTFGEAGGRVRARLVADDDTFYGEGESGSLDQSTYRNHIEGSGVETHFMQTNGYMEVGKQYQHNKYIVVDDRVLFCGAGNFTTSAFRDNYENFYLIDDAAFAQEYTNHFERMFRLAQPQERLPADARY